MPEACGHGGSLWEKGSDPFSCWALSYVNSGEQSDLLEEIAEMVTCHRNP